MDLINKIKEYFLLMEMYEGRWVVAVKYNPKWAAYSSEDGNIEVVKDEKKEGVWWYYAVNEKIEISDIINFILETASTNIEAIKKVELFKIKAGELKKIFSDETLTFSKLETLKFVFEEDGKPMENDVIHEKKDIIKNIGERIKSHDIFEGEDMILDKKSKNKKRKKSDKNNEESLTSLDKDTIKLESNEMTKEEIDELRG